MHNNKINSHKQVTQELEFYEYCCTYLFLQPTPLLHSQGKQYPEHMFLIIALLVFKSSFKLRNN